MWLRNKKKTAAHVKYIYSPSLRTQTVRPFRRFLWDLFKHVRGGKKKKKKIDHFWRKNKIQNRISYLKIDHFWRKNKIQNLISYLKIDHFWRKNTILNPFFIFENPSFLAKNHDSDRNKFRISKWRDQRVPDTFAWWRKTRNFKDLQPRTEMGQTLQSERFARAKIFVNLL